MDAPPSEHPPGQVLDAFGLGKLDDWAAVAVSRHLESCPSCRRRVAELPADTFLDHFRGAEAGADAPTPIGSSLAAAASVAESRESSSTSPLGDLPRLQKYAVLRCLGDGGQGSAYLARDPDLGRLVVLKRHHVRGVAVELEGQSLARVRSPYTAQCHAIERQDDELFLVMEYIPGNSLSEVLKRRTLAVDEAVRLVEHVAEGLEAVHACGLVHRDVKPSNIILGDDGVPRLVDFGLAAHLGSPALRAISGSPPYMAPEQARGQWERIDARTDVYGLGSVLYHLLTGQPPRDGKTPIEILEQARADPIVPPRRRNPRAPRALERVCLKAMAADPHSRFPSAAALRRELYRYRLMRHTTQVLGAAVVLFALLATAWTFWPGSVRPSSAGQVGASADRAIAGPPSSPTPPSDLRVTHFEIVHYPRGEGNTYDRSRIGPMGSKSFTARVDDDVTLRATLSRPAYSYLIAFRADGTDELCDPDDAGMPPPRKPDPAYPPLAKSGYKIRLSEGPGLYAFAVVVSRDPLPVYRDWMGPPRPPAWSAKLPGEPGVVWRDDGESPRALVADDGVTRGKDARPRGAEEPVAKLARWLRGLPGVDAVTLEAFSVEPGPGP
jgi:serine/threonine-protein kinase